MNLLEETTNSDSDLIPLDESSSSREDIIQLVMDEMNKSLSDKKNAFNFINIFKIVAFASASITGLPYLAPAKRFAGDNELFGYLLMVSEFSSIGALTIYIFNDLIDDTVLKCRANKSCCDGLSVTAFSLGFFTALPAAIVGFVYNDQNFLYSGIAFYNNFFANSFALNNVSNSSFRRLRRISNPELESLEQEKKNFLALLKVASKKIIHSGKLRLIDSEQSEYNTILIKYLDGESSANLATQDKQACISLLRSLIHLARGTTYFSSPPGYTSRIIATCLAAVLPMNWAPTAFKLVFNQSSSFLKFLTDNQLAANIFSGIFASCSTVPIYLLEGVLCYRIFFTLYDLVQRAIDCSPSGSISEKQCKALLYISLFLSFALGSLSFATKALVIDDNYPGPYGDIAVPWTIVMTILYKCFAFGSCITTLLDFLASTCSKESNTTELLYWIDKLSEFVDQLPAQQLDGFLTEFKSELSEDHPDVPTDSGVFYHSSSSFFPSNGDSSDGESLLIEDEGRSKSCFNFSSCEIL